MPWTSFTRSKMAKRRAMRPRGRRRPTSWMASDIGVNAQGSDIAAGVTSDNLLLAALQDSATTGIMSAQKGVTVIRIVGSVVVALQNAQANQTAIYWGIYVAREGVGGSYRIDPSVAADLSEETWMHWRCVYNTIADDQVEYTDQVVDIRTARKLEPGDSLRIVFDSVVGYHRAFSFRVLTKTIV